MQAIERDRELASIVSEFATTMAEFADNHLRSVRTTDKALARISDRLDSIERRLDTLKIIT